MKIKSIIIGLMLLCTFNFYSCSKAEKVEDKVGKVTDEAKDKAGKVTDDAKDIITDTKDKDTVSGASRAKDAESFEYAVKNSWIVIVEKDLTIDKDVTLDTGFKNSKSEEASRILVIFSKDDNDNVKDLYTLTVPKLTIVDKGAKIEGGTLKGDVYVDTNNVTLQQATVDGNVYFSKEEYKNSFVMDENSKVTGNMEVK